MPAEAPRWMMVVVIGWASMLSATVATILFFASFDPVVLSGFATFPTSMSPLAGYTLGFFFFWGACALSAALSAFLCKSLNRRNGP